MKCDQEVTAGLKACFLFTDRLTTGERESHEKMAIGVAWILALWIAATADETTALTAYDCGHRNTTYQALNLRSPAPCADPERDFIAPRNVTMAFYQTTTNLPVKTVNCQVLVSKRVTRCGYDGLTYGTTWTILSQNHYVPAQDCLEAANTGVLTLRDPDLAHGNGGFRQLEVEMDTSH